MAFTKEGDHCNGVYKARGPLQWRLQRKRTTAMVFTKKGDHCGAAHEEGNHCITAYKERGTPHCHLERKGTIALLLTNNKAVSWCTCALLQYIHGHKY